MNNIKVALRQLSISDMDSMKYETK